MYYWVHQLWPVAQWPKKIHILTVHQFLIHVFTCTSLAGAMSMDTLLSSTSITLDKMVLVVFNSEGRREVPLVSVATVSWVVREAVCSKISTVVLFEENISSACRNELWPHECHSDTRQRDWDILAVIDNNVKNKPCNQHRNTYLLWSYIPAKESE